MNQFTAMVKARTMEFVRDKGAFYWNILFPLLMVFGFSVAFSNRDDTLFQVGITGPAPSVESSRFLGIDQIEFISYEGQSLEELTEKVRLHKLDMLLDFNSGLYYLNSQSSNAEVLRHLIRDDSLLKEGSGLSEKQLDGNPIRYVDWLVPGVIGMNMLFSCLFGVGFVIVRYRKNGVLKRLKATPVTAFSFVSAQMVSRFLIVLATSVFVYTGTNLFLKFMMLGSYLDLLLITAFGILCMISLGLIFAGRMKNEELASGLMNLITFPMIIFSGVFFSLEGSPLLLQKLSKVFPLTHFIQGARDIMLEGAGFTEILPNLAVLGAMTVVFLTIATLTFSWD